MRWEVRVPPTADGALQVTIRSWHMAVGDTVTKGADLVEAKTEKITLYVTAPANGKAGRDHGRGRAESRGRGCDRTYRGG